MVKVEQARGALGGALFLVGALFLAGCSPAGVAVGAGAKAGSIALEERGFEQGVKDRVTEAAIAKELFNTDLETFGDVEVEVYEDRVLLTGVVREPEDRIAVLKIALSQEGVTEVINEILVGDPDTLVDSTNDAWISAQLRTKITFDQQIKAVNYVAEVSGGVIYLLGIAQNQAELDRVVAHAREIESVRRVVRQHVVLKDDPRREKYRTA